MIIRILPQTFYSLVINGAMLKRAPWSKPLLVHRALSQGISLDHPALQKHLSRIQQEYKSAQAADINTNQHLQPLITLIERFQNLQREVKDLLGFKHEVSVQDKELQRDIEEEISTCQKQMKELEPLIFENLLPPDPDDDHDVIIEITAGVGGQESMLFAKELFHMYEGFSRFHCWSFDILSFHTTELGGLRTAVVSVKGKNVSKFLKFEAGVHRVQRVPKTEKSGRMHTSTVAVAVLPQPAEHEIKLDPKDLMVETKRASGPGGQHVNKSESCVRIRHIPSGLIVECQSSRFQHENRNRALQQLKARVYQMEKEQLSSTQEATKKSQVGLGERSDKIRTYNFAQDRITDHRLQSAGTFYCLQDFLEGSKKLNDLVGLLLQASQSRALNQLLEDYK